MALASVAEGNSEKLPPLAEWLGGQKGIAGRFLPEDICSVAGTFAVSERGREDGALDVLLNDLRSRPESTLVVLFRSPVADGVYELPGAKLGRASALAETCGPDIAGFEWPPEARDRLAAVITHPAQGRLGAVRTATWLQTVLGAICLGAYVVSREPARLVACPAIESATFLADSREAGRAVEAALKAPAEPAIVGLDAVFSDPDARQVVTDATARSPKDLAQARLTATARWLQAAASAVTTADALLALGAAFETLTGDDVKSAVVERVTKRAAVFLASAAAEEEKEDVYQEELKRAKRLYALRSRASHGQYDELKADRAEEERIRTEFYAFVLEVCLGFRSHSRARNMRDVEDLKTWWARAELEGLFA